MGFGELLFDPEETAVFGCHTSPNERMPFSVPAEGLLGDAAEIGSTWFQVSCLEINDKLYLLLAKSRPHFSAAEYGRILWKQYLKERRGGGGPVVGTFSGSNRFPT